MRRMIFVTLPVSDLPASRAFYTSLGITVNETFSDDQVTAVVVSDTIVLMLLTRDRFGDFVTGAVGDPRDGPTAITCLSAGRVTKRCIDHQRAPSTRAAS